MRLLLLAFCLCSAVAHAQVYRWVDAKGMVHYSDSPPPAGVRATTLDIDTQPGAPAPDSKECFADQGTTPVSRRGRGGFEVRTWTYLPTSVDPFTTTITLVGGRVGEVERVRKF